MFLILFFGEKIRVSQLPPNLQPETIAKNYHPQLERLRNAIENYPSDGNPERQRKDKELFGQEVIEAKVQTSEFGWYALVNRETNSQGKKSSWFNREPTLGEPSVVEWSNNTIEYVELFVDSNGVKRKISILLDRSRLEPPKQK